jgi:hypothetical protein
MFPPRNSNAIALTTSSDVAGLRMTGAPRTVVTLRLMGTIKEKRNASLSQLSCDRTVIAASRPKVEDRGRKSPLFDCRRRIVHGCAHDVRTFSLQRHAHVESDQRLFLDDQNVPSDQNTFVHRSPRAFVGYGGARDSGERRSADHFCRHYADFYGLDKEGR